MAIWSKPRKLEVAFDIEAIDAKIEELTQILLDLGDATRKAQQTLKLLNRAEVKSRERLRGK